jgi:MFS family permease
MVGGVVGVMGAALISPLHALYQQAWQLKTSDILLIYVLHMCGGMCALLFLGRLPDRIGFQRVMPCFLLLTLAGTLIWPVRSDSVAFVLTCGYPFGRYEHGRAPCPAR